MKEGYKAEDEKFMHLAIKKAREGVDKGQTPFGACIVRNGEVIALEHNDVWDRNDATGHGEMNAIRNACKKLNSIDLSGCVIYSTCEPCPMCFTACHWAKISKIVFGARIEDAKSYGFNELTLSNEMLKKYGNSSIEIEGDFLREENIELFKYWESKRDKRVY